MTTAEILDLITQGGIIGLLVLITVGGWRRWFVWYWTYKELADERDWWRRMALSGGRLAEKATDLASKGDD